MTQDIIRYASICSGIGGFEKGIEQASELLNIPTECVFASEIDKFATWNYRTHFDGDTLHGDITQINESSIPDIDMLVGGFPCQSFSIAGKRRGFEDNRGNIFFHIARIIKEKRPKIVFLENVKGLLSHDKGRTFGIIGLTLVELGYDVEYRVLNSKDFGVPQNRERVFIIGHLRGHCRGQVFPLGETNKLYNEPGKDQEKVCEIASTLMAKSYSSWVGNYVVHSLYPRSSKTGKGGTGHLQKEDGFTYCLDTGINQAIETVALRHLQRNGRLSHTDGYMGSLQTSGAEEGIRIGQNIRKLTPIECERLQGFPDNWTLHGLNDKNEKVLMSNSQRYKQLGNAVTVNVIQAIAEKILYSLKDVNA